MFDQYSTSNLFKWNPYQTYITYIYITHVWSPFRMQLSLHSQITRCASYPIEVMEDMISWLSCNVLPRFLLGWHPVILKFPSHQRTPLDRGIIDQIDAICGYCCHNIISTSTLHLMFNISSTTYCKCSVLRHIFQKSWSLYKMWLCDIVEVQLWVLTLLAPHPWSPAIYSTTTWERDMILLWRRPFLLEC